MSDIFISYVEEDARVAVDVAGGLEQAGYSSWYYTRDSLPVVPYLQQVPQAIDKAKAMVLLISRNSVKSFQVTKEVVKAYEEDKVFVPVLVDFPWEDIEKVQPQWKQALGAATGIKTSPEAASAIVPRLVAGLKAMGIEPQSQRLNADIADHYPYPLASSYGRQRMRSSEPGQSFQFHEDLRDIAEAIAQYVASALLGYYRDFSRDKGAVDTYVERELAQLAKSSLKTWVSLFHTILGVYAKTADPTVNALRSFYFEKSHRENAVAEAAIKIQEWLGLESPRKPPFAYEDLFELLSQYRKSAKGWGALGSVLTPEVYRARADVLAPALDQALIDLAFLKDSPLVAAAEAADTAPGETAGQPMAAMGRDLVPLSDPSFSSSKTLAPGHVLLCWAGPAGARPLLDLYPLLTVRKCRGCERWAIFALAADDSAAPCWQGSGCGHRMPLSESDRRELDNYIANRRDVAGAGHATYLDALREMTLAGELTAEDRQKLEFLAKMLKIRPETAAGLDEQFRREMAQPYAEAVERILALREPNGEDRASLALEAERRRLAPARAAELERLGRLKIVEPFLATAAEAYAAGSVPTAEGRSRIEAKARDLGLSAERAAELEAGIRAKLAFDKPAADGKAAPAPSGPDRHLESAWREPAEAPVRQVAVFGCPAHVLSADETGFVCIRDEQRRIVFQERNLGVPYRALAAGSQVLLSSWEGRLYGFGVKGLAWQTDLGSPVSALAAAPASGRVFAGAWSGTVRSQDTDGHVRWTQKLKDGIAALAAGDGLVACATYSGMLALYDPDGRPVWLRELAAPAVEMRFLAGDKELLIVRRDRTVARLVIADQRTMWEQILSYPLRSSAISVDGRLVAVSGSDGYGRLYAVNGGLHLRSEYAIPDVVGIVLPADAPGDGLVLGYSPRQLYFINNRTKTLTKEIPEEAEPGPGETILCVSAAQDGRAFAVGGSGSLAMYNLARPQIRLSIKAQGAYQKGKFTRVEVRMTNEGLRPAQGIRIEVAGPVDLRLSSLPDSLAQGRSAVLADQSLEPKAAGAVPVVLRAAYRDDLDLSYEEESRLLLDVND